MKKINTYSAQYKIISEQPAQLHSQNHPNLHNKLITNSYSKMKKLTSVDFIYLTKIIESLNQIFKERLNQVKLKQEK